MDQSSQSVQEATRRWLAGLLAQRELGFYDRLAARARWRLGRWNAYWATLSRRGRRAVGRRLAPALLGASLLGALVLTAAPVHAAGITADGTVCTLIEAIESAESDTAVGGCASGSGDDVITMTADVTLLVDNVYYNGIYFGLPLITTTITIDGNGHTIDRHLTYSYDFTFLGVMGTGDLTLNDVVITRGDGGFNDGPGGILNFGNLTINESSITENRYGGIYNYGDLTLNGSSVSGNGADNSGGGGITNLYGTVTLNNSTVSDNYANRGGGILNYNGMLVLNNSTVTGNSSRNHGGGINNYTYGSLTMTDSTVSNNTSFLAWGGGIYNGYLASAELTRSIVSGNNSHPVHNGDEVWNHSTGTITTGNYNVFGHDGLTSSDAIVNFTPSGSDVTATSDGSDPTPLAAILSPAADNGGPTLTHALPAGSLAIDIAPTGPATDQRGEPRPAGAAFDAGAYEAQGGAPANPLLYLSPRSNGVAGGPGGIPIKTQDIAVHDLSTGNWAMYFDGSDVGVNKPIAAFTRLPDGSLLLAFTGPINLPGVNGVTPSDIVRFTPSSTGDVTSGAFELYFDGSDVGLSTSSEKIDAIDATADDKLLISTTGNALVPLGGGVMLKAQDEDLLAFAPTATGANTAGTWSLRFDGTAVPGLAAEDVAAAHLDEATGDLYLAVLDGFNVDGVTGKGKDILKLSPNGGGYTVSRFWRGADNGFNLNIGGLEME